MLELSRVHCTPVVSQKHRVKFPALTDRSRAEKTGHSPVSHSPRKRRWQTSLERYSQLEYNTQMRLAAVDLLPSLGMDPPCSVIEEEDC